MIGTISRLLIAAGVISAVSLTAYADKVVILHTNDTHSQIEPDGHDRGGVARRKVLIDSVRAVEPNVILVDAGDAVQGSLYFTLFGGDVESKVMNEMGYDIQILGNHEFDNGIEWIADYWKGVNATKLATNYNLQGTPLDSMAVAYEIVKAGDRRIGFFAINLDPNDIILDEKFGDIKYLDPVKAANSLAWYLKNVKNVDKVVAITHIGYANENDLFNDRDLIKATDNIDILIGGHSHTAIFPYGNKDEIVKPYYPNASGDSVLIAQTGRQGFYLGQIDIDFDKDNITSQLIPVDKRLDSRVDESLVRLIAPYKHVVDSIKAIKIGKVGQDMNTNEPALLNWMADYVYERGKTISGKNVDLAIVNKGGVRRPILKGDLTKGAVMETFPFENKVVVLELKGDVLAEVFDTMAKRKGEGVSKNVDAVISPQNDRCESVKISGKSIDPDKIYRVATIDYLANGKDDMVGLKQGIITHISPDLVYDDMIADFVSGKIKKRQMKYDGNRRMHYADEK
ncbi:MAG: bifunctional metallophosphatase/5'-nucleotidase [Paramuribaculum sp.]|nr:bifunctional metallophosphatase/5'-nucleotidase [Paramuribaculum sp.]